jgi:UMP-CMP kinase
MTHLSISHLLLLLTVMQRQGCMRCYAFASNLTPKPAHGRSLASYWGAKIRGGNTFSSATGSQMWASTTTTSSASSRASSQAATPMESGIVSLAKKAKESLPIAGSCTMKDFGGLSYLESSNEYRVLFVLGGPGAGKGTQSEMLVENFPCVHLSAGQLLRDESTKPDSKYAKLINECLVAGTIVPVEISLSLLKNAMEQASGKSLIFLVDGFPRNFDNLDGWTGLMPTCSIVLGVLNFHCPISVLEKRILERAKASGRSDDNLTSLRKRFTTFEKETIPVVDSLRLVQHETSLQVFDIQGDQPLETVWQETRTHMNSFMAHDVISANAQLLQAVATRNVDLYTTLCAAEIFSADDSPENIMQAQEGNGNDMTVHNAKIEFITGAKASVSYDRIIGGVAIRETRIWSHQWVTGWRMIHFSRSPASS